MYNPLKFNDLKLRKIITVLLTLTTIITATEQNHSRIMTEYKYNYLKQYYI